MTIYDDITEEEIKKFKPLLDRPIEDVKQDLQSLSNNYYKSIVLNDNELFSATVAQIKKYLEFDIVDINEYLNYCLVIASNEILKKICDVDAVYIPNTITLQFRTSYARRNEDYIKQCGLDDSEVELLTQYVKEKHDINCLVYAIDENLINKLKPKTKIPKDLAPSLISSNYIRDGQIKKSGELFFALDKAFSNYNKREHH